MSENSKNCKPTAQECAQEHAEQERQRAAIRQWNERLERLDERSLQELASQIEALGPCAATLSRRELLRMFRGELCQRLEEVANE